MRPLSLGNLTQPGHWKILSLAFVLLLLFVLMPKLVATGSLQIADSAMAEGADSTTYQPINRTQVFTPADTYAYSWIELADVYSPSHNVTWIWLTPNDNIYFRFSYTIPDPGQGRDYPQYYVDCDINVEGSSALFTRARASSRRML